MFMALDLLGISDNLRKFKKAYHWLFSRMLVLFENFEQLWQNVFRVLHLLGLFCEEVFRILNLLGPL